MIITLLTDFGSADSYVAEVKGVLLACAPGVTLVDITHEVPPGDVRAAQYLLARAWKRFPDGTTHLAVVDPGVGSERRAIAAHSSAHRFVAPDNGLLSFVPKAARFVSIPQSARAAPTFHARDIFAPAAAALARGASLEEVGSRITDPYYAPLPASRRDGAAVVGEVIYVDRFGTLISNIPTEDVPGAATVRVAARDIGSLRRTFADVASGELVAFRGSGGTIEIAVRDGSAALKLKAGVGASVTSYLPPVQSSEGVGIRT